LVSGAAPYFIPLFLLFIFRVHFILLLLLLYVFFIPSTFFLGVKNI